MRTGSRNWSLFACLVLAIFVIGCEGESPTAPPIIPPGGGGGGQPPTTPNQQVELTVTASNPNPLVNSTSTITATATQGGQPVPAGTAIEFASNTATATFLENNGTSLLRVTTNGVATATLSSSTPGPVLVTVRVGAVVRTLTINFQPEVVGPPPGGPNAPTITNVSPTRGTPQGGELVTITGTNFQQPVRVLFGDTPGNVISVTSTQIQVISPPVQLNVGGGEQRREVTIRVINQAGTTDERAVDAAQRFAYELAILTPFVFTVSPSTGPNEGNTRITIFGSGFQPPTKVFFGTGGGPGPLTDEVEVEVLQVFFDRIIAMTPPALGLGNPFRDQQVTIRVLNVLSNQSGTLNLAFRYGPSMEITSVSPLSGTALGGTRVTINGWGFDDPVQVTINGVTAQPIEVTGTKIVVVTGALLVPCASESGNVIVHNVEDDASDEWGDDADEEDFDYIGTFPSIVTVSPNPALPGQPVTVTVRNPGIGTTRFQIGENTLLPTPSSATNPTGDTQYTLVMPSSLTFDTEACTDASGRTGVRFVPSVFDVTFTNIITGCGDTVQNGITINPTDLSCRVPPDAVPDRTLVAFSATCGTPTDDELLLITNAGGTNLIITGISSSLPGFQVVSPVLPVTVAPGAGATFTLRANVPTTAPTTPSTGTINITSNDPTPPGPIQATTTCTP